MATQERALRTREALIRSAAEIFHQEGFATSSLATISGMAGVSSGALHFHFASKSALADAVEEAASVRLRAVVEGPQPRHRADSSLQDLVDATYALAQGLSDDVVLRAGFELSGDPARPPRTDLREQWQLWVEQVLEQADKQGELRPEVAPEGAVTAVVAGTVGLEVLSLRKTDWLSPQTIRRFWQLLLPTLASGELLGRLQAEGTPPTTQT